MGMQDDCWLHGWVAVRMDGWLIVVVGGMNGSFPRCLAARLAGRLVGRMGSCITDSMIQQIAG